MLFCPAVLFRREQFEPKVSGNLDSHIGAYLSRDDRLTAGTFDRFMWSTSTKYYES